MASWYLTVELNEGFVGKYKLVETQPRGKGGLMKIACLQPHSQHGPLLDVALSFPAESRFTTLN